jgi:protein involved in polysaccharide export with SLBB domain
MGDSIAQAPLTCVKFSYSALKPETYASPLADAHDGAIARWRRRVIAFAAGLMLAACATGDPMRLNPPSFSEHPTTTHDSDTDTGSPVSAGPGASTAVQDADDLALNDLWQERTSSMSSNEDYPIGPGDILMISVPQMDELQERRVRVSTTGTIELPLVGSVQAGGLTEDALQAELDEKLNNFMYNPQASVFVEEYHNREVAVIGAVNHPGLVLLNNANETVLDVLTQAGGLASTAADEIILIPIQQGSDPNLAQRVSMVADNGSVGGTAGATATDAGPGAASDDGPSTQLRPHGAGEAIKGGNAALGERQNRENAEETASTQPDIAASTLRMLPGNARPLTIKIRSTSLTGAGKYINLPMRPGDVIVVPGGGNAMVVGWVQTPGYFQVGSGLTVLGAIGAAGGPMYAADTKDITLIRSNKDGSKETIPVNLDRVSKGTDPDLPVKANDVIDVPYSGLRIGPYIFYSVISRMGLGGPAIPF